MHGQYFEEIGGDIVSNPFRAGGEALLPESRGWRWHANVSNPFRAGGEALAKAAHHTPRPQQPFQTPSERAVRRC